MKNKFNKGIKYGVLIIAIVMFMILLPINSALAGDGPYIYNWEGHGLDSENCDLQDGDLRPATGWIHWVFANKGASSDAQLVLSGSGSGTYAPGDPLKANVWHFYTEYFDVYNLSATITLFGGDGDGGLNLNISDFCPGSENGENGENGNGTNGNGTNGNGENGNGTNGNGTNGNGTNGNGTNGMVLNGNGDEHCDKCALVVLKRDEDGHPIDGAVFEVDGVQKTIKGGKARWDDLECDTTYEVKEISPNDYSKGIHLGDCGERSTMRVVNKIEVGELEVLGIMEVLPFTGPTIPYSPFIGISTVLAGTFLYILSKPKKKR